MSTHASQIPVKAPRSRKAPAGVKKTWTISLVDFAGVYQSDPSDRVAMIRAGVPATDAKKLLEKLDVSQGAVLKSLNLSTATLNRKVSKGEALSAEDSERIVGMSKLIGQVQTMVEQSGAPDGFDAVKWVAGWLQTPVAALGGGRPVDYMDTMEGQGMVSALLARMQSGAYA